MAINAVRVIWHEDSTPTALARITAADATGDWTGNDAEGNFVKQADLSSITCAVYNLDSTTPATAVATPTVTISDVILDTPDMTRRLWKADEYGYNFKHTLSYTYFATGGNVIAIKYTFVTTGGAQWVLEFKGPVSPVTD